MCKSSNSALIGREENTLRLVESGIATLTISEEADQIRHRILIKFTTDAQRSEVYILNDFLQITATTSIILYIIEIRKKSSIEWCKEMTPSDRSFRIADWRYYKAEKLVLFTAKV